MEALDESAASSRKCVRAWGTGMHGELFERRKLSTGSRQLLAARPALYSRVGSVYW